MAPAYHLPRLQCPPSSMILMMQAVAGPNAPPTSLRRSMSSRLRGGRAPEKARGVSAQPVG
eukprot:10862590-Prorocentrum_lima.AAC.1